MTFQDSRVLGKYAPTPATEVPNDELLAAYHRIDELTVTLEEARLQLEYLHEKFNPTGTTEAILARIDEVLS